MHTELEIAEEIVLLDAQAKKSPYHAKEILAERAQALWWALGRSRHAHLLLPAETIAILEALD